MGIRQISTIGLASPFRTDPAYVFPSQAKTGSARQLGQRHPGCGQSGEAWPWRKQPRWPGKSRSPEALVPWPLSSRKKRVVRPDETLPLKIDISWITTLITSRHVTFDLFSFFPLSFFFLTKIYKQ